MKTTEGAAPADQTLTRNLLRTMFDNGALNEGEYRALVGALRADLIEAVWVARALERQEARMGDRVTLDCAPTGTVVVIGHPANGSTATKRDDDRWHSNLDGRPMDLDPRDARVVYLPGERP